MKEMHNEQEQILQLTQALADGSDQEDLLARFDRDKQNLVSIRHGLMPYKDLLVAFTRHRQSINISSNSDNGLHSQMIQTHSFITNANARRRLRDGLESASSLLDDAETAKEELMNTHANYQAFLSVKLSRISNRVNIMAKDLTLATMVYSIIAFISAIYGMNIALPFSSINVGSLLPFVTILSIFVVLIFICLVVFRCLRWLQR
ncbi:MAG: hypothetical protein EZS28_024242 [Streblomastix strix]|uniref:Magnesium transporter n=1 Tax=Streblomastix strix TaxID=222440 RepID=A0A5J4VCH4_9EUKA|nr:MAG: hypothetical protein EZS28_024242 [Streblomastix strix]